MRPSVAVPARNALAASKALYLPLKVRCTAVVVAKGATFAAPGWW